MKVERRTAPGFLWEWLKSHLPAGLTAVEIHQGYGVSQYIYRRGYRRSFVDKLFENEGDSVAAVDEARITLNHPEYFSDFEDLIRKYEAEIGQEVTFIYWESPSRKREAA